MSSDFVYTCYSKTLGFGAFFQFVLVPVVERILLTFKWGKKNPVGSIRACETTTLDVVWVGDFCTSENRKYCLKV